MGQARAVAVALLLASTANAAEERFVFSRSAMGTTVRIVMYASGSATAIAERAFLEIERVEAALSDYRAGSDVSRITAGAGGRPVTVPELTRDALEAALRFAAETAGAFDPTIAPVVRLWREARKTGKAPSDASARKAFALVGYRGLELGDGHARLAKKGMALDLGGIGKGFACDRALSVLRASGITSAIVSAGGDFAVGDPPPGDPGWWIRIEGGPTLTVSRCGISTSGASEQYVELGGTRYSHIIDPRNGKPVIGMGFVTIVAENATASDALATACSVLGRSEGLALAERRPNTEARIRWRPWDSTTTVTTSGFDALVAPEPFRFVPGPASRTLMKGDQPVWETITSEPEYSSTGFKVYTHLYESHSGQRITGARLNPYPHHRGVWIGWQKVTDGRGTYNFWEVPDTTQRFMGFIRERERASATIAVEAARIEWVAPDGRVIVREIREWCATVRTHGTVWLEVASELSAAGRDPVSLDGDAHHAGCQVRLAAGARDLEYRPVGAAKAVGNDVWTGVGAMLAGFRLGPTSVGVVQWHDKANPGPVEYSTRAYGRFGSRFSPTLQPGVPRTFRWTLLVAGNDADSDGPPPGGRFLFDGTDTSAWRHADGSRIRWTVSAGAMTVNGGDIFTTFPLEDALIHLEFRLPSSPPDAADQHRANSGVYLQERYEIQILDSSGDDPRKNGCGAIYEQRAPDHNMSMIPGVWQTYDITFRQPRWDAAGKKIANARVTVTHNGMIVHRDVEITAKTGHGKPEGPQPLPLKLQDHGHPVAFRNIWILPLNP